MRLFRKQYKPLKITRQGISAAVIMLALLFFAMMVQASYMPQEHSDNIFIAPFAPMVTPTPDPNIIENETLKNDNGFMRVEISSRAAEFDKQRSKQAKIINVINKQLGGKLANKGEYIYKASIANEIPPFLPTSIMIQETGAGRDRTGSLYSHNNVGGFMGDNGLIHYKSVEQSISKMCEHLKRYYVDKNITSITAIGKIYCPVGAKNDPTNLNKYWKPAVTDNYIKLLNECGI